MKIIDSITHIVVPNELADSFHNDVAVRIKNMQSIGLEVEVQYQQCDNSFSALILGRREKEGNQS